MAFWGNRKKKSCGHIELFQIKRHSIFFMLGILLFMRIVQTYSNKKMVVLEILVL